MNTKYYKINGCGKKSLRGNRFARYNIDGYIMVDGQLRFLEQIAWGYTTLADAEQDMRRIKAEDEARGCAVEVVAGWID